jgi:hypothetical protein
LYCTKTVRATAFVYASNVSSFNFTSPFGLFFPEKTFPCLLAQSAVVFPVGPNKKKEKIETIFCPKGGLAVINESKT